MALVPNAGPSQGAAAAPTAGPASGSDKVAILLPLSGPRADIGQPMLQAAQLALDAPGAPALIVKDTGGTAEGAAAAAQAALAEGAGLILGPLTSGETASVAPIARQANVAVLAFTNDPGQIQPGVWPLGISPGEQVRRLVTAVEADGKTRIAAMLPDSDFGRVMANALTQAAAVRNLPPPDIRQYAPSMASINQTARDLSDFAHRRGPIDAQIRAARADQHFTEPPPRYSEASLVKKMEELGIGRPSTYASILTVLRDRAYVKMDKNRFVPEDAGRLVTAFLEQFFLRYVEYDFTADLEEKLDLVSAGSLDWKALLREFWTDFHAAVGEIGELRTTQVLDALNTALGPHIFPDKGDGIDPRGCPACASGRLSLKTGRYGAFIGCSNYPECRFTRPIAGSQSGEEETPGDRELGVDPASGHVVWLKTGRFGPYVEEAADKPKRASLPKDWPPAAIDLDKALRLLRLPREVGAHPHEGGMIHAGIGRYGPYVQHGATYANLANADEVFEVGLNRAVAALAEKRSGEGRGGRGGEAATPTKELGLHPVSGKPVRVLSGRYGPYVKHETVNANVPKGADPATLTLAEAVLLLAAREGRAAGPKRGARAPNKSGTSVSRTAKTKKAMRKS